MDGERILPHPRHKQITTNLTRYNSENSEKCEEKCKEGEIHKLLSLKKLLLDQPRTEKCQSLQSEAEWDDDVKLGKVTKFANNITKNYTHSWNKKIYLHPEACLFLLEMKSLMLKWKGNELSIQNAYNLLLTSSCTFKQFRTYSYLVKLGFRVFKFDNKVNIYDPSSKNLTKLPEKHIRRKQFNYNNSKNFKKTQSTKPFINFPNITSADWIMISTPSQCYLPHNLQPISDFYLFKITVSPMYTEITAMLSDYYFGDCTRKPFFEKKSLVYDSSTSGSCLVYQKDIPDLLKSDVETTYEPQNKKFKLMKTNDNSLSVANNMTNYPMHGDLNGEEHNKTQKEILPFNIITMASSSCLNVNPSNTEINYSNSTLNNAESFDTITEDEEFSMESTIPSHIKKKLFAIKPAEVSYTSNINSDYFVRYDVYYPNNIFPKKKRPVADFRVIVFEDDINDFPNICDVNVSNPHDNIPTLWAIVNSSSVSFYNVNNIIIPKATDWKIIENK